MENKFGKLLKRNFPEVILDVDVADLTTFKVGGTIAGLCDCPSASRVADVVRKAKNLDIPYYILGGGTNVVFGSK